MESRGVNCNRLYVKVCQWGELPLNKLLDKQNLLLYMFRICALISCNSNTSTNAYKCKLNTKIYISSFSVIILKVNSQIILHVM